MIADIFGSMLLWFLGWFMLIGGMIANFLCGIFIKKMILFWIFLVISAIGGIIILSDGFIR